MQKENRLIEFIKELDSRKVTSWDKINNEMIKKFGRNFRINITEANYLTKYYKGELNFNTKIINL